MGQPTAPFREGHVEGVLRSEFNRKRVPFFADPSGNLILGVRNRSEYQKLLSRKSKEPLRLFVAHMDHPGFHGQKFLEESRLSIRWFGGAPTEHLDGARVWLADAQGWLGTGEMQKPTLAKNKWGIQSAEVVIRDLKRKRPKSAKAVFGGFAFRAPYWEEDGKVYTKAADDLVGAFAISSLAIELFSKKRKERKNFLGILTRAEEVGFIGAIAHFDLGWHRKAKRPLLCVSLETSRTLPNAEIGKGPVVRLGDRATVFDANGLQVLTELAQKLLKGKFQRRIMDGGTCEATAATAYGIPSIGISIPLGNYHNQSFEGGPDSRGPNGPAPEFVHLDDVEGMLKLCRGLVQSGLPWENPWKKRQQRFTQSKKRYRNLLESN